MTPPAEVLLVMTHVPDNATAERMARGLVEEKVAACVTLLSAGVSVYCWQGNVENAQEIPLLIKTTSMRYAALEVAIRRLHPYELPEIIAVPVVQGLPGYLQWVVDETKEAS